MASSQLEIFINILKFVISISTCLISLIQNIQKGVQQNG